jgi:hypothetical protein
MQNNMTELSVDEQQTPTRIGGWFNWIKWNRCIDHGKNQEDRRNASKTEARTFHNVCLKNGDEVSNERVEIYPGL